MIYDLFVPRDAVHQVMEKRNIAIERVEIFLESSRTPLPLIVDCFPLGGHTLHVKGKLLRYYWASLTVKL